MLFPTLDYIFFLPLVIILFWMVPWKWRLSVLGLASILFYGSWQLLYLNLLIGVCVAAWVLSFWVHQKSTPKWKMTFSIFVLFIPLLIFKYSKWIIWNINELSDLLGFPLNIPSTNLALPVGISFFTFQAVAYLVDSHRESEPTKNPWEFFTFLAFFPQLVAGPIVRRKELLPQLKNLQFLKKDNVSEGIFRIVKGMAKKLLIADVLANAIVDIVFQDITSSEFAIRPSIELWIALYAYTIQIYYDFSAYTDIAIGSALLFGIRLPENFNRPYKATCVAGFWRRWHITLSNWVRDYIYYPLGGSKTTSDWKVYRNIIVTMIVIGMWHGASWNFVIYGVLHGSAVSINRYRRKKTGRKPSDPVGSAFGWFWRFVLTFHFVVLARILFRTEDLKEAWIFFTQLWDFQVTIPRFQPFYLGIFLVGFLVHFTPDSWHKKLRNLFEKAHPAAQAIAALGIATLCWELSSSGPEYFIYYNF